MGIVLITGGNGNMGRYIIQGLRTAGYNVISTSRTPNEELGVVKLDVRDTEACISMMKNVDVLICMGYIWFVKPCGRFYQRTDKLSDDIMRRPHSPYGLTKCFAELCSSYCSDSCGISVINGPY
jgi:nucleoside-diphosphate-sugar epimerase